MRPLLIIGLVVPALFAACGGGGVDPVHQTAITTDSLSNALGDLDRRIVADPRNAALYAERARVFRSSGKAPEAIEDWKRALLVDSLNAGYHVELGDLYYVSLKIKEAQEQFETALRIEPENNAARLKEAELQVVAFRQYQKAFDLVNAALRSDPGLAEGYYIKGWAYMESGDTDRAISSFRTTVERDPAHYKAFMELGKLHALLNDPLALDYYNTAIDLRPGQVEAWYGKGMYCQENGKDSLALECYDRIKQIDPRNATAWYNSGFVRLEHLNDLPQAIRDFTAAGKLLPSYHQAFYNRGLAYERKGVLDSAAMDFQQTLRIKPDYDPAALGLQRLQAKGLRIVTPK